MGFRTRTEEALAEIHKDLKEARSFQATSGDVLLRLTVTVEEHVKRTNILEKRVDSIWTKALTTLSIASALTVLYKALTS